MCPNLYEFQLTNVENFLCQAPPLFVMGRSPTKTSWYLRLADLGVRDFLEPAQGPSRRPLNFRCAAFRAPYPLRIAERLTAKGFVGYA
jgi:hypothetical protein